MVETVQHSSVILNEVKDLLRIQIAPSAFEGHGDGSTGPMYHMGRWNRPRDPFFTLSIYPDPVLQHFIQQFFIPSQLSDIQKVYFFVQSFP